MEFPEDLRYTKEHEWARAEGQVIRVGITDFAQDALGDVVYVDVPEVGAEGRAGGPFGEGEGTRGAAQAARGGGVEGEAPGGGGEGRGGEPFGEVESTKSVSDVYAPVTGRVVERNGLLGDSPQLVNEDPYGQGGM